ncbi:MAG: DUF4276 family protein [Burkholderiaceae bacterium]|nr:MAG: DUF4276 family protein [Burkholderiaceae bacterium]
MKELVFCLEGSSEQAMLEGLLPKLLPTGGIIFRYIKFEGKQDLEKQLSSKLRGYKNPSARFVVIRDQDSHPDCKAVKARLVDLCTQAGKPDTMVRIACTELESFYLADLAAVERGLEITGLTKFQENRKFRSPDHLGSPSKELSTLTKGRYQKVSGSRAISVHLDLENTRSDSFRNLVAGIRRLVA